METTNTRELNQYASKYMFNMKEEYNKKQRNIKDMRHIETNNRVEDALPYY